MFKLMNTATASFNTAVRQMTEMSQRKKKQDEERVTGLTPL